MRDELLLIGTEVSVGHRQKREGRIPEYETAILASRRQRRFLRVLQHTLLNADLY